jgi:orotate phosphoribosyltransferase-like protein
MKVPEIYNMVQRVGKLRLKGLTNAQVRDELNISEDLSSKLWQMYRKQHNLPASKPGKKK